MLFLSPNGFYPFCIIPESFHTSVTRKIVTPNRAGRTACVSCCDRHQIQNNRHWNFHLWCHILRCQDLGRQGNWLSRAEYSKGTILSVSLTVKKKGKSSLLNIFNYYSHRHGITAYAHTSPDIYSSYPGLAYPGHSSGIVYSNPHTGSDALYSQPPPGADVYSPPGYSATTADVPDEVLAGSHYKRKGRSVDDDQPRQSSSSTSTQIDFAEIMFTFLNVNTMDCKRRFVCEVDFLSKRDPWIRMGYNMLG